MRAPSHAGVAAAGPRRGKGAPRLGRAAAALGIGGVLLALAPGPAAAEGRPRSRDGEIRADLIAEVGRRPQDALAHAALGRDLARAYRNRSEADWRPAAAALELALQLDPSLASARTDLAALYSDAGRPGLAAQLYAEALAVAPGDRSARLGYAQAALRSGDLTGALWAARSALAQGEDAGALAVAVLAGGLAGASDGDARLARLAALDPLAARTVSEDLAAWRRALDIAAGSGPAVAGSATVSNPAPASAVLPIAAVPSAPPVVPLASAADWRACQPAGEAGAPGTAYGVGEPTLNPQPLQALPAPCAAGPAPRMAVVEAVIVRQNEETLNARGVNLLSALQLVARGRVRVAAEADPTPSEPTSNFLTLSLPDNGIAYLLNVLNRQQTSAEVLAKPSLVALDRTPSVFFSGATLTVPVTSAFTGTLQEKSVGVSLAVTPTFVSDDEVLLAVSAGRSFLDDQIRADLDQGIETTNNTVAANVRLRFGETLVLSGLSEREHEVDRDEAPGLGRLPIGNLLLGNRQSRSVRKSVVVLLTLRRPNEDVPRAADDSLLPRRYDRRLAAAVEAAARRETPEADRLDAAAERLRRADLIARLPWRLPGR